MKYTFRPDNTGTHIRTADGVRGHLREHADTVTIRPASALVDAAMFTPYDGPLPAVPEPARELSKLTLKRRLESIGKWDAFKAVLAANPSLDDEFWLAQTISTADPMFTTHAPALKAALGLTEEQFAELLA